jgi:RNA polymerase sigma-70 factor (ECF subfamily)
MKDARRRGHEVSSGGQELEPEGRIGAEALFRAHAAFVAAFLHRLGVPASEVDDLVQEVFLVAHRKGGYVPGPGRPRTWLAEIALRVASSVRRARGRRTQRERLDGVAVEGARSTARDAAEVLEVRNSLRRVQQALETLDIEHRAAFVLYEIEGENCESIAASFGVPIGTVYSRLHHARRRFLDAYAALAEDGAELRPRFAEGA